VTSLLVATVWHRQGVPRQITIACTFSALQHYEEIFRVKIIRYPVFAFVSFCLLLSSNAFAGLKVDEAKVAELGKIAVVGYSFFRWSDSIFEPASPFAFKKTPRELPADDPEFLVMQHAGNRTLDAIAKGGSFTVIPSSEIFPNEQYQATTTDSAKKKALNWYFPEEYRVIKLKKNNAKALCEALGVDAVVQIHFSYSGRVKSQGTTGISWGKSYVVMKGEITMIDSNGNTLVSGSIKSDKVQESSGIELGDSESSSVGIGTSETGVSVLYPSLLTSFLEKLEKELGH